jgi:hypothetical protein
VAQHGISSYAVTIIVAEVAMSDDRCSVEHCTRERYARRYCEAHYRRLRRTGSVSEERLVGEGVERMCMVDACANAATERGLCHGHYLRLIRYGDVQPDRPLGRRINHSCTVENCAEPAYARQMCRTHYRRFMKHGDPRPEMPLRARRAHGRVNHGYRIVTVRPEERWLVHGRMSELEHRLVMARLLGRALTPDESVHHRNGDRLDNDPGNLELWSRWQPRGQRVRDKLEWAIELLQRYLPEALAGQLPLIMEVDLGTPERIRTAATALRGRRPRPLDDGG